MYDLVFQRRIKEVESQHVADAERLQIEHRVAQVGAADFRHSFVHEPVEALG